MKLNKSTSFALIHVLNGLMQASQIAAQPNAPDVRSVQRALQRLVELGLVTKQGSNNNPKYNCVYENILQTSVPAKLFDNDQRPDSQYRFQFIDWLGSLNGSELDALFPYGVNVSETKISAKELEHLTVELSWKSSSLEGNTYTLLDTQLLLTEGVRAKNRTEFETQMILNHKDAIAFIMTNLELFRSSVSFATLEELHKIIGKNLDIESGLRRKLVGITASNYKLLSGPQQLREQADKILGIISKAAQPYGRALLALSLIPYLQAFEDGNKRTGRLLANALLLASVGRGFSLRKTDARSLSIAYLSFYEFSSLQSLDVILKAELKE